MKKKYLIDSVYEMKKTQEILRFWEENLKYYETLIENGYALTKKQRYKYKKLLEKAPKNDQK